MKSNQSTIKATSSILNYCEIINMNDVNLFKAYLCKLFGGNQPFNLYWPPHTHNSVSQIYGNHLFIKPSSIHSFCHSFIHS